jgi:hypothetical protein
MKLEEMKILADAYAEADKLSMDHFDYLKEKASPAVQSLVFKEGAAAISLLFAKMKAVV